MWSWIVGFIMLSTLSAIEETSAGNHPPHSNKWTPSSTHKEYPVCDVSLPGGTSPVVLKHNIQRFIILDNNDNNNNSSSIHDNNHNIHEFISHAGAICVVILHSWPFSPTDWKWGKCADMPSHHYWAAQTVPASNFSGGEKLRITTFRKKVRIVK